MVAHRDYKRHLTNIKKCLFSFIKFKLYISNCKNDMIENKSSLNDEN